MSVPVGKRSAVDREHYLDATQRYVCLFRSFLRAIVDVDGGFFQGLVKGGECVDVRYRYW